MGGPPSFPDLESTDRHLMTDVKEGGLERGFAAVGFAARRKTPISPSPRPPPKASGRGEGAGGGVRAWRNFNARKKCQHISPEN